MHYLAHVYVCACVCVIIILNLFNREKYQFENEGYFWGEAGKEGGMLALFIPLNRTVHAHTCRAPKLALFDDVT